MGQPQGGKGEIMKKAVILGLLGLVCCAASAFGATELQKKTLEGLEGVKVIVEDMRPEVEQAGLTKSSLQTLVELELRKAGIRVLTEEERLKTKARPWLYLRVSVVIDDPGSCAFDISLWLNQAVILAGNGSIATATTWDTSRTGTVGKSNIPSIKDHVREKVEEFCNDFLAANPVKTAQAVPEKGELERPKTDNKSVPVGK